MSETETRWLDDDDGTLDARTVRQLRRTLARYKDDRDKAWARCANEECECVESVQAELARLRGVVEAVQALADEWADYEWTGPCAVEVQRVQAHTWEAATKEHARVLRAALTPVSSSGEAERPLIDLHGSTAHGRLTVPDLGPFTLANGIFETCSDCTHFPEATSVEVSREAESGEAVGSCGTAGHPTWEHDCKVTETVRQRYADDDIPAPVLSGGNVQPMRDPYPAVLSGGQADGEGETEAEKIVARLDTYTQEQHAAGIRAARERRLAARPVLSREALRERLDGHWPIRDEHGVGCGCGWEGDGSGRGLWRDHLADVLAGGEQRG